MAWKLTVSPVNTSALINARNQVDYEIEAIFTGGKYYYQSLISVLPPTTEHRSTVYSSKRDEIRHLVFDNPEPTSSAKESEKWERKFRVKSYPFIEQSNVYINVKGEQPIPPPSHFVYDTIRYRTRYSYQLESGILSLTTVVMVTPDNGQSTERYEIELEWHTGSFEQFVADVNYVYGLIHPSETMYSKNELDDLYRQYGHIINQPLDRAIFNRPTPLTYHQLVGSNPIVNSYVSWKADGHRRLLISYHRHYWLLYPPFEANRTSLSAPDYPVVADVEVIGDNIYLFDVLYAERDLRSEDYSYRYDAIPPLITNPRLTRKESYPLTVTTFFDRLADRLNNRPDFATDGIIFTDRGSYYQPVYKWKAPADITIDFLVVDNELLVYDPQVKAEVPFTGTSQYPLPPVVFPSDKSGIYEYRFHDGTLIPYRSRPDKGNANTIKVVLDLWKQLFRPLTADDLTAMNMKLVFQYHNRVKTRLFDRIRSAGGTLLDLGSGKGGDLVRFSGFTHVYAVEPNDDNRAELELRASRLTDRYQLTVIPAYGQDFQTILRRIPHPVSVVSMMLSLSFFTEYDDLVRTIDGALAVSGYLILFTIDGNAVAQIPYDNVTLLNVNLTINYNEVTISIPGSIVGEEQHEYRVNLARLIETLGPRYRLVEYRTADGYDELPPGTIPLLSPEQLAYTRLYSYLILQKQSSYIPPSDDEISDDESLDSESPESESPESESPESESESLEWGIVVPTIGDGNCFFHAVLMAVDGDYRAEDTQNRQQRARNLRLLLGSKLADLDPRYPGYCYWETLSRLSVVELLVFDVAESSHSSYSLESLQAHFRDPGNCYIGIEAYPYISLHYHVNLVIVGINNEIYYESSYQPDQPWVVILAHNSHYELVIPREDQYQWSLDELGDLPLTLTPEPAWNPHYGYQTIGPTVTPQSYYQTLPPWHPLLSHLRPVVSFPLPGNRELEQHLLMAANLSLVIYDIADRHRFATIWELILSDINQYFPYYRVLRSHYRYY